MNIQALVNASAEEIAQRLLEAEKDKQRRQRRAKREVDAEERPAFSFEFLDDLGLDAQPGANWLVHGLLLDGGLGLTVGEPGTCKTFVMLDLALSIAAGRPTWLGRRLNRHGAVVYVAGEGQGRFKHRKNVWKQEQGITRPLPFHFLGQAVDLRDQKLMSAFLKRIEGWKPVLVVFDTLSRCIPGAEENSAKELGEAIAACDIIKGATGANVQLLHHPRKAGDSSRGSGAGLGAVDSELWMKKTSDKNLFQLSVGKQKEGDDDLRLDLKRRIVELVGLFEPDSGEPVTSCVIELADVADVQKAATAKLMAMNKKQVNDEIKKLLLEGRLSETLGGRGKKAKLLNFVSFTPSIPF